MTWKSELLYYVIKVHIHEYILQVETMFFQLPEVILTYLMWRLLHATWSAKNYMQAKNFFYKQCAWRWQMYM